MVAVTSALLSEGLTVQLAGGARLDGPGKHAWGAQPSSLCLPELLPTPLSLACSPQSPSMVQAELEMPGSWRKDQLDKRYSLVPLAREPAA